MYNKEMLHDLAMFLEDSFLDWQKKHRRSMSQAEFSKWLNVPPTSYSQWVNELRPPMGNNIYKLAAKLGPRIYDILESPRMMPQDPLLNEIYDIWFELREDEKDKLLDIAREMRNGMEGIFEKPEKIED